MNRIIFWFIGVPCSGKTTYARKLGEKLGIKIISLDLIDYLEFSGENKPDAYKKLLSLEDNIIIMDGIIPFSKPDDLKIVNNLLKDDKVIKILVNPEYEKLIDNIRKRGEDCKVVFEEITSVEYQERNKKFLDFCGNRFISVKEEKDLDVLEEDIRSMQYQHDGFTDIKWESFKIDCKDKTVLDLGCSSCWFEKFSKKFGAKSYLGLDVNKAWLFNENARYFDLNNLEDFSGEHDIVISSSMIHYIKDKEKFIRECSRLTKEVFVLELPVAPNSDSMELVPTTRGLFLTSKRLTESWIEKYFKSFICLGESIVEDGSYRLIYKCFK